MIRHFIHFPSQSIHAAYNWQSERIGDHRIIPFNYCIWCTFRQRTLVGKFKQRHFYPWQIMRNIVRCRLLICVYHPLYIGLIIGRVIVKMVTSITYTRRCSRFGFFRRALVVYGLFLIVAHVITTRHNTCHTRHNNRMVQTHLTRTLMVRPASLRLKHLRALMAHKHFCCLRKKKWQPTAMLFFHRHQGSRVLIGSLWPRSLYFNWSFLKRWDAWQNTFSHSCYRLFFYRSDTFFYTYGTVLFLIRISPRVACSYWLSLAAFTLF